LTLAFAAAVALAAFLGGFLGSLLGLGGGILIVPAFTLVLDMPVHVAVGTSLVAVVATSSMASSVNLASRLTNARLALVLATVTAAGALVGGLVGSSMASTWIMAVFGLLLAAVGVLMLAGREAVSRGHARAASTSGAADAACTAAGGHTAVRVSDADPDPGAGPSGEGTPVDTSRWCLEAGYYDPAAGAVVSYRPRSVGPGLGFGFLAGVLSGMLGVGGGVVQVPVMNLLLGLPMKAATSTSSHIISLTAMAGAVVYLLRGFIDPLVAAVAVLAVFLGARTGARLAHVMPGGLLRKIFSVVLFYAALRMLARAFNLPLPV